MEKRLINPTPWLQHFNINHGVEVKGAGRTLYHPDILLELEATASA